MKRWLREDSGSSVAELALVLPTVLLLLFGIVEGSRVLGAWMILTHETREAARYAVAGVRADDANLASEVSTFLQGRLGGMLSNPVSVSVTVSGDGIASTSVTVHTSTTIGMETPFTKAVLGNVPVNSTAVMMAE